MWEGNNGFEDGLGLWGAGGGGVDDDDLFSFMLAQKRLRNEFISFASLRLQSTSPRHAD